MKNIRDISQRIENGFAAKGIAKFSYTLVEKETRELNAENGEFSLLRTLFDNNAVLTAYKDGKNGTVTGNDFSESGIDDLVASSVASAEAAIADPAHDFAPKQDAETFQQGVCSPDFGKFFDKVKELIQDIKVEYPKIQIMNIIGEFVSRHVLYRNSNGTDFEGTSGAYGVSLEFSGHDGDKTTNLDYCGFETIDLDTRLIDQASVRYHLDNAQKQLEQISVTGKFEGNVIFTPECFAEFMMFTAANYLSDGTILEGTSLWKDKVGQQVASENLTVCLKSSDSRIVCGERFTGDGFRTEDLPIIENGILKNFIISLYTANKTGKPVSKNSSRDLIVESGSSSLDSLVKATEKGLIVGGFSGGQPSSNGDFSGVAKNSYYIENGQIKGAVSEVMINGNLGAMLMDIKGITAETVQDGGMVVPYVCVGGIVVSGK